MNDDYWYLPVKKTAHGIRPGSNIPGSRDFQAIVSAIGTDNSIYGSELEDWQIIVMKRGDQRKELLGHIEYNTERGKWTKRIKGELGWDV
jgi:hypothetical protein